MRLTIRAKTESLRSSFAFSFSGVIHGALLGLVAFGNATTNEPPAKSLYDEMIRPGERRLVWYHLQDRLPDASPPSPDKGDSRPLRALRKLNRRMVVGAKDKADLPEYVKSPAPANTPRPLRPLPNILAFSRPEARAPTLPDAPAVSMPAAPAGPALTPLRRIFAPPPLTVAKASPATLPEAPATSGINGAAPVGPNLSQLRKAFVPPPATVAKAAPAILPDAPATPSVAGAAPVGPNLSPLRKTFAPPPATIAKASPAHLPDAPAMNEDNRAAPVGPNLSPLRKTFNPPPVTGAQGGGPATLPDAPAANATNGAAPLGPNLSPLRKAFTPPPAGIAASAQASLPDAPGAVAAANGAAPVGPNLAPLRKSFNPPPAGRLSSALPSESEPPSIDTPQLAVVSLDPSKRAEFTTPPPPKNAGFSAGPTAHPEGATADGKSSGIVLPGVTIREGVSRDALLAAIRPNARAADSALPAVTRVSSAPDPTLQGRAVYSIAIQMPNVTSYSGSWLVWFAEREPSDSGTIQGPSPLRKVDPKYIASAVADRVEGVVRLAGVIRRDGRIDSIRLLRHLDDRLDQSAMESLAKWAFEPARRSGVAIEVDAVFEIPFRLAPKPRR